MITKNHRFYGKSSLRFVYQKGQTVRSGQLALRFIRNNRQKTYRVAVVVSRKVSKHAVVRNRIRRRLYEVIRLHSDRIVAPFDLVLTVYNEEAATMHHPALRQTLLHLLQKANVLTKANGLSEAEHDIVEVKETNT